MLTIICILINFDYPQVTRIKISNIVMNYISIIYSKYFVEKVSTITKFWWLLPCWQRENGWTFVAYASHQNGNIKRDSTFVCIKGVFFIALLPIRHLLSFVTVRLLLFVLGCLVLNYLFLISLFYNFHTIWFIQFCSYLPKTRIDWR